jgi:nitrogen PTS system EIIA component
MDKCFLTVKEMSLKLGVSEKTIYRMISAKTIPFAIKIGGQWRFNSEKIEKWIVETDGNVGARSQTNLKIKVAEAVSDGLVIYRAHGENRDEILDEIFAMFNSFPADVVLNIKKQVLYKESIISSSLQGMALMAPEQTVDYVVEKSKVIIAFLDDPTDLNAIDGSDTEIVFLLLAANKSELLILRTKLLRLLMESEFVSMLKKHPHRKLLLEEIEAIETALLL